MNTIAVVEGHDRRNRILEQQFTEQKVDVLTPIPVDHFFSAPARGPLVALGKALQARGYTGRPMRPPEAPNSGWYLELELVRPLSEITKHDTTVELVTLAAEFGADYDGWGASV